MADVQLGMLKPRAKRASLWLLGALTLTVATGACRRRNRPVTPQAPAWLEQQAYEQVVASAPGSQPLGPALRGVARHQGARQKYGLDFEKGHCYLVSAVGDRTANELYLNLWDPEDDRIAKKKNRSPRVVLEHCAEHTGRYYLEVKVTRGYGHFVALPYRKPAPGAAPAGSTTPPPPPPPSPTPAQPDPAPAAPNPQPPPTQPPPTQPSGNADLAEAVEGYARRSAVGASRVGGMYDGTKPSSDWYAALDASKCYWFVGVGGRGVDRLELSLRDPRDQPLASAATEAGRVVLKHCPSVSAMYRLNAKVLSGQGEYKVGIYARKR